MLILKIPKKHFLIKYCVIRHSILLKIQNIMYTEEQRANKSAIKDKIISNQQSVDELHKSIIIRFKKRKVQSSFKGNICGADLINMQLISKYNKGI